MRRLVAGHFADREIKKREVSGRVYGGEWKWLAQVCNCGGSFNQCAGFKIFVKTWVGEERKGIGAHSGRCVSVLTPSSSASVF